jgi:hypothetical protein
VERDVERAEARLADLERKLAEDWGDAALADQHRSARLELDRLLAQWESLFDASEA